MIETASNQDLALAIRTQKLNLWYGTFQALFDIDLDIKQGIITSMIGPSGCGKSTFLRSVNRINERLGYVRITGSIDVMGENIYDPGGRADPGTQTDRHGVSAAQSAADFHPGKCAVRTPNPQCRPERPRKARTTISSKTH